MADLADDPSIPDDALLWRRVGAEFWIVDANLGRDRPSSNAFEDIPWKGREGVFGMSLYIESEVVAAGRSLDDILLGYEAHGVVSILAREIRAKNQKLVRDDNPDDPGHIVAIGPKSGSAQKHWHRTCAWVRRPRGEPKRQK